ncbi:hypothetical protein J3E71DRAFT_242333 [Bipolaris maydis]|nr:hypothetical protein J3E71DRAFT_242333 [Bipolaris maydis]
MPVAGCPVGGHPFILPGADWNSTAFPATSHPAARKHTQARAPIHTRSVAHTCAHNTILWHWRRRVDASTRPHTFSHTTDKPMPRHRAAKKKSEQHTGGYSGKRPRTAPGEGLPNAREACEPFLVASGANRRRRHSESMPGAGFLSTRHWAEAAAAHPSAGGRGCTVCCNAGGQQALLGGWPCTLLRVPALVADATTADPPVQPLAWLFVALQVRPSSAALPQGAYHLRGFSAQITLLLARPRERP